MYFLFPQKPKETYYTAYKKETNLVSSARGKLWDKYNNLKKEIEKTNQRSTKEITPENYFMPSEDKYCVICSSIFILILFVWLRISRRYNMA